MDLFLRSWTALRTAVAETPDEAFDRPSCCAQDVLITLVTRPLNPSGAPGTHRSQNSDKFLDEMVK